MAPPAGLSKEDKEKRAKEALEIFLKIGLDEKTAQNAVANSKVVVNLTDVIREAGLENGCDKAIGNLLYTVATRYPAHALVHRVWFLRYIISGQIKSLAQVEAALALFSVIGPEPIDTSEFEEKCGVGVVVSEDEIRVAVQQVVTAENDRLLAERYRVNAGFLLSQVRALQPWADLKAAREELDLQLKELLGERTAADDEKPAKKKEKKKPKAEEAVVVAAAIPAEEADPYAMFPKPQENNIVHTEIFFSNGDIWRPHNSRETLERHLAATGGRIFTRFPPEPNGYLHIGHAKAMNVSFGLARERGGCCYLRFDDTNPEAEKQEYIDHIHEIVQWLGWTPFKVTHSADYFQELYDLAVQLIRKGYAYVDHQTAEEIKDSREQHVASPWRNRPIEESLRLFERMRRGQVAEGEATLRMRQDMGSTNPNMYDLIAYRIKFAEHPHSGDKWCIYPSYDYTHCIVDSLENITHSLCTLEFETRRAPYYWLLEALGLYHPHVWEYARLSITNTVLSKRKLNRLVTDGHVDGWDDPRLFTLAGLRRRGASPSAINAFCRAVGITRSDNVIRVDLLEHFMRDDLNRTAPRSMAVLQPLKVVVTNLPEGKVELLEARHWPEAKDGEAATSSATYQVAFSRVLYIEASDFRVADSKDYYGLAPGKTVMLRFAYPVKCTSYEMESDGTTVKEVHVEYDSAKSTKPKGVIHWVAEPSPGKAPLAVEVRLIDKLFKSENPGELDDWLADLNPASRVVIGGALAVEALRGAAVGSKFQFERIGYFCVDQDSTADKLVFNRTVTLRSSSSGKAVSLK